jgi:glucose 1-dehydrogenase/3-oxoacyl-[acyl-carrier protein] reductase
MGVLEGQRALVTGAGIGIGQGVAVALAAEGARVAVHYAHSADGARQTVDLIETAGGTAMLLSGDLRSAAECLRVVDGAIAALGGLDILVNNAGVTRQAPLTELSEETYDELFDLNVKAYYFCAQRAVQHMTAHGGGAILNLSSIHGHGGVGNHTAYAATKGAVNALTRALAIDLAPHRIRVNAIAPGAIEVPRFFDDPAYPSLPGSTWSPWGRVGQPSDIAVAAVFLLAPAADYVNGQVLYVDGGVSAKVHFPLT